MATTSTPPPLPPEWQQAHLVETFKALHTIAIEGLKMLALVNGGAAVAVLTYAGNTKRDIVGPGLARWFLLPRIGCDYHSVCRRVLDPATALRGVGGCAAEGCGG